MLADAIGRRNRGGAGARARAPRPRATSGRGSRSEQSDSRRLLSWRRSAGAAIAPADRACVAWTMWRDLPLLVPAAGAVSLGDDAGRARDVARVRARRRSLRARSDRATRRRSYRRCGGSARRISPRSIRPGSCNGCSTATRRSGSGSPPRRRSRLAERRATRPARLPRRQPRRPLPRLSHRSSPAARLGLRLVRTANLREMMRHVALFPDRQTRIQHRIDSEMGLSTAQPRRRVVGERQSDAIPSIPRVARQVSAARNYRA